MLSEAHSLAPIAVFIYKRPEHTRRTLESLLANPESKRSPIYVFADGPNTHSDRESVTKARLVARDLLEGTSTVFREHDTNLGLAQSIVSGVSELCSIHGRVIVIEDDMLLSPSFLAYINSGLHRFEHYDKVMQISGYVPSTPELEDVDQAMFLPFVSSWGWATWSRAWKEFDPVATGWQQLMHSRQRRKSFDLDGHYPYTRMLTRQMNGQLDSWAIRWYYSVYRNNGLVLFPPSTLVHNIGLDGSGTHSTVRSGEFAPDAPSAYTLRLPSQVELSPYAIYVYKAMRRTLFRMRLRKLTSKFPAL